MAKAAADKTMPQKGKGYNRRSAPGGRITSGRLSGRAAPMAASSISGVQCGALPQPSLSRHDEEEVPVMQATQALVPPVGTQHHETIPFFPQLEPAPPAGTAYRTSARHGKQGRRGSKAGYSGRRASHQMLSESGSVPHYRVADTTKGSASVYGGGSPRGNSKADGPYHGVSYGSSGRDYSKTDGARYGRRAVRESARKRGFVTKLDEPGAVAQPPPAEITSSEIMPSLPFDQIDQLLRGALMERKALTTV